MKIKIIILFIAACITFSLMGCTHSSFLYRVDVQQGNVLTPDMTQQLRIGMTKEAVCDLLGPPLLIDAFNDNRWTYVFTFKPGRGAYIKTNAVLYFRNGRLYTITSNNNKT